MKDFGYEDPHVISIITDALSAGASGEDALGRIGAAAINLLSDAPKHLREKHLTDFVNTVEEVTRALWAESVRTS